MFLVCIAVIEANGPRHCYLGAKTRLQLQDTPFELLMHTSAFSSVVKLLRTSKTCKRYAIGLGKLMLHCTCCCACTCAASKQTAVAFLSRMSSTLCLSCSLQRLYQLCTPAHNLAQLLMSTAWCKSSDVLRDCVLVSNANHCQALT